MSPADPASFADLLVVIGLAAGIVVGILRADGTIDRERMEVLVAASRLLKVVFPRAFDSTPDADMALVAAVRGPQA